MEERTLHTILDAFQKPDLQDLGNILGSELSPRLRKSQLVDQLCSYLHTNPGRWLSHLMERDVRLLRELVHAGPEKVQYQDFADYPSILEVSGLVQWDDSDENYHKVWISREVYDIVASHVEKAFRSGEKSGQWEVERVALGYLNLYGIVPTDRFLEMLMDWYEEHHAGDYEDLTRILRQSPLVKMYRYTDQWGDYLVSPCVENTDSLFELRESLKQSRYAKYSPSQAREAGCGAPYFTVGMKTPEGMRLEQMYRRVGYEGFELVKAEHDTWIEAQYTEERNDNLFQPLNDSPMAQELDDSSWEECCRIVCEYANSVPKWFLCGHTARQSKKGLVNWEELKKVFREEYSRIESQAAPQSEEYPSWTMPEPTITEGFAKDLGAEGFPMGFAIPHVAPNDPCPCGSGLRYCRCHGKFLS